MKLNVSQLLRNVSRSVSKIDIENPATIRAENDREILGSWVFQSYPALSRLEREIGRARSLHLVERTRVE